MDKKFKASFRDLEDFFEQLAGVALSGQVVLAT